jgi:hypothetical protein
VGVAAVSDPRRVVVIDYTNWRGVRKIYYVQPTGVVSFENNEWHSETQWLLEAVDQTDSKTKMFAVKDIHSWRPIDV